MNKVYIDGSKKSIAVDLPKYGEVILIVKDGKVVRYEVKSINKLD